MTKGENRQRTGREYESAAADYLRNRGFRILERNFQAGGPIRINHKDIKNVIHTAHAIDVPIPYTAQLFEILQALKIHGHEEEDHGGIVQYFEGLADVEVKCVQRGENHGD